MIPQMIMAGIGAAGSFISGAGARRAAKRTERVQDFKYQQAHKHNEKEWAKGNKRDEQVANWLNKQKEVTTERTTGGRTSSTSSSFDADAMLKAAEASGINPITFLRNGGMAAFIKTDVKEDNDLTVETTRKGHNAVAVADLKRYDKYLIDAAPTTHVPSSGEAVGGAISQFANAAGDILAREDAQAFTAAQAEKHQGFQKELMMMSLAGAQKGGAIPGGRSFYTPGFSTSGGAVTRQTQGGLSALHGNPRAFKMADPPEVTNPNAAHWIGNKVDPTLPDITAETDRYGESELAETINYAHRKWNDFLYNATGLTSRQRYDRWGKPLLDFIGGLNFAYDPKGNAQAKPLFLRVTPKAK